VHRAACWHVCVKCVMCENEYIYIYVCAFANMCTDRLLDSIAVASIHASVLLKTPPQSAVTQLRRSAAVVGPYFDIPRHDGVTATDTWR
jgi:hypothetical protein